MERKKSEEERKKGKVDGEEKMESDILECVKFKGER